MDPGNHGGIATIALPSRIVLKLLQMPLRKKERKGKKAKEVIDVDTLANYFQMQNECYDIKLCAVEFVHAMPKQGVTSMFTFALGYGAILGILAALNIKVAHVDPGVWKDHVLPQGQHDKEAAISYCQQNFSDASLIPKGCRTPQDGLADALCIAQYGIHLHSEQANDLLSASS